VTSLTKVTADKWAGNALVLYLFLISGEGEKLAREQYATSKVLLANTPGDTPEDEMVTTHYYDILRLLEDMLLFDAWLARGPYGPAGDGPETDNAMHWLDQRIRKMLKNITTTLPRQKYDGKDKEVRDEGNGWKLQKFHKHLNLPRLVRDFGSPQNFNASVGESHLKTFAKLPSATVQKTSTQIMMDQMANRIQVHSSINHFFRKQHIIPVVESYKKRTRSLCPFPETRALDELPTELNLGGSKVSHRLWIIRITRGETRLSYSIAFPSKAHCAKNAIYPRVQDYELREFGDKLLDDDNISSICITGYGVLKRDDPETSLRAMPRFLNGKSWHDWVMAHYDPEECDPIIAGPDAVPPSPSMASP
jgi:hypothetical protein